MREVIGRWWDYEVLPSGEHKLIQSGTNAVSVDLAVIFAMSVKPGAAANDLYWAVGDGGITGDENSTASKGWDTDVAAGTRAASSADTGLIRETFRKLINPTDVSFVDAAGNASAVPTNNLLLISTFVEADPSIGGPSYFREWGVVGGTKNRNGTGGTANTINTGFLVDHKLHTTYVKQPTSQLVRKIILTF